MSTPEVRSRGTRLPRTARRSQLLGAAREVFVAQGYHAAAMDEIADRAGVSKPVLYQHFPGKRDLYLALIDQHSAEVVDCIRAGLASTRDNKLRGVGAINAFFDFIDRENESFRLIFESDLTNDPDVRLRVEAVNEQTGRMIAELLHEETGLPWDECELLGMGLSGMAHVAARYWLQKGRLMPREEAVRLVSQLVWRGVAGFPRLNELAQPEPADPGALEPGPATITDLTETATRSTLALDPASHVREV
jgi:AcrR family transcriptional regulator